MSKYVNVVKVKVKPSLRIICKARPKFKGKHLHCLWKLQVSFHMMGVWKSKVI